MNKGTAQHVTRRQQGWQMLLRLLLLLLHQL
jgi:hypothetical protein